MTLTVDRCCCGCTLRTGTLIIAIYKLICSVLLIVLASVGLGLEYAEVDSYNERNKDYSGFQKINVKTDTVQNVTLITAIVGGVVLTVLNALLLIGVRKENRRLVLVWLVSVAIIVGLDVITFVARLFQRSYNWYTQSTYNLGYEVGFFINIGLTIYFLLVVRSFYYSLADGHHRQQNAARVFDVEKDNSIKVI